MVPPWAECYRPGLFAGNENYFDDSACAGSLLNGYNGRQSLALEDAFFGVFVFLNHLKYFVFV